MPLNNCVICAPVKPCINTEPAEPGYDDTVTPGARSKASCGVCAPRCSMVLLSITVIDAGLSCAVNPSGYLFVFAHPVAVYCSADWDQLLPSPSSELRWSVLIFLVFCCCLQVLRYGHWQWQVKIMRCSNPVGNGCNLMNESRCILRSSIIVLF